MSKFVDLRFIKAYENLDLNVLKFKADKHIKKCISVLKFPIQEFTSEDPNNIAKELYFHTTSINWHSKLRRVIKPGDMFFIDKEPWVFLLKTQIKINCIQPVGIILTPFSIVNLNNYTGISL